MNAGRVPPPQRVPTLTEVVDFTAPAPSAAESAIAPPPGALAFSGEAEWVARVLAQLQHQIDASFEARLRDALAPLLARSAEALIREARAELTGTMHAMVTRAVALELARARGTLRGDGPGRDGGATPE